MIVFMEGHAMRMPILDVSLCAASFFSIAATVAVYAGPSPDLRSIETMIAAGSSAVVIDDAMITSKVQAVLGADPRTAALRIAIDTKDGVVSLAGVVPSAEIGA